MAVKYCTVVVALLLLLAAISLRGTQAQGTNKPQELEAFNTSVVEATVHQLNRLTEINAQLEADNRFIRRIAWVETADGTAPGTFSNPTYHGGIWRVDESIFDITKLMFNDPLYASIFTDIDNAFCINWGSITWNDCRRPLYSALAARLYFHSIDQSSIPNGVENQATKWKAGYNSRTSDTVESFAMKVSDLEKAGCDTSGIDLIFVLDGSGSVGPTNFATTKTFVLGMVDFFNIGANDVRVGVIQYTALPRTEFHLNQYTDKDSLKQAISNIAYWSGDTLTGLAIDAMVANFSPENGARPSRGIPRVGVVITDGQSHDSVTRPANAAREMDITIFAIGVTSSVNNNELNAIANKPKDTYVFHAENFNAISNIGATLQYATCDRSEPVFNETINNTISRGQRQKFQVEISAKGVSIMMNANSGTTVAYLSTTTASSSESDHDHKMKATGGNPAEIYINNDSMKKCGQVTNNNSRKKRQAGDQGNPNANATIGTVYMTIEGLEETNNFVLIVTEGDVTTPTTEGATTRMTTLAMSTFNLPNATLPMTTSGSGSVTYTAALTIAGFCTLINCLSRGALYK